MRFLIRSLLILLPFLINCEERIQYQIHAEVVYSPVTYLFNHTHGLYYDFDGKPAYVGAQIKRIDKYYRFENGQKTELLGNDLVERIKRGK